jgi:hypothetical protein
MHRTHLVAVAVIAVLALAGCSGKAEANSGPRASMDPAAPTATPAVPPATSPAADPTGAGAVSTPSSPVDRIVFVGKENACQCTRTAIDASWTALQEALGGASIPIEKLTIDTQAAQVAPYRDMQAILAIPAIYFFDALGGLVNMLQGEVTADAIRAILFP